MDLKAGDRITILEEGRLCLSTVAYVHRGTPTFRTKSRHLEDLRLDEEGITWLRSWDLSEDDRMSLLAAYALLKETSF